jgi:hypothetical protein
VRSARGRSEKPPGRESGGDDGGSSAVQRHWGYGMPSRYACRVTQWCSEEDSS